MKFRLIYIKLFIILFFSQDFICFAETEATNNYQDDEYNSFDENEDDNLEFEDEEISDIEASQAAKKIRIDASSVRQFHDVLDDLLAEFAYDVRLGQLKV